jgi:hypothetical protein
MTTEQIHQIILNLKESEYAYEKVSTKEEFETYCDDVATVITHWEAKDTSVKVSKLIVNIKFEGVDDFHRPIFKEVKGNARFGDCNNPRTGKPEVIIAFYKNNINFLEYFGRNFNCEPNGGLDNNIQLKIVE